MTLFRTPVARGMFLTILGGICWGVSGTCGQFLFSAYGVDSLWLTSIRLLSGGLLMTLLALVQRPKSVIGLLRDPRDVLQLVLYGTLGLLMVQYAYLTGIYWSNAATTTVLQNLGPSMVMVCTCLLSRRLPTKVEVVALLLALFGVFLLATGGNPGQVVLSPKGLFWGIMSAVGVVLYTLIPRSLLEKWERDVVVGLGMLVGGIAINLYAPCWSADVSLPLKGWLCIAVIVILGTVLSFSLVTLGITVIGPIRTSMLNAVEPVTATILAVLWLGTSFTATDLIAFAAILTTVVLLAKSEN